MPAVPLARLARRQRHAASGALRWIPAVVFVSEATMNNRLPPAWSKHLKIGTSTRREADAARLRTMTICSNGQRSIVKKEELREAEQLCFGLLKAQSP